MKRVFVSITTLLLSLPSWGQSTAIQSYIENYPVISDAALNAEFEGLLLKLEQQKEDFRFFYEGPKDQGTFQPELVDWFEEKQRRAEQAQAFVASVLKNRPTEELNLFTLELMDRYLNEPSARPALKELFQAFQALKFNDIYFEEKDAARDWRPAVGQGAFWFGMGAGALCIFRPSLCDDLARQGRLVLKNQKKMSQIATRQSRRGAQKAEENLVEMIRQIKVDAGLAQAPRAVTLGAQMAKKSFFQRYLSFSFKENLPRLAVVTGVAGAGGGAFLLNQRIKLARQDGKFAHEALDPNELEQLYFGGLAVLELNCQTRLRLKQAPTLRSNQTELRNFILSAQEEVLLLGRMAGGLEVYDKTELEFVRPSDDGEHLVVNIPLTEDRTHSFTLPCPGAHDLGEPIHASLSELEALLQKLILANQDP